MQVVYMVVDKLTDYSPTRLYTTKEEGERFCQVRNKSNERFFVRPFELEEEVCEQDLNY